MSRFNGSIAAVLALAAPIFLYAQASKAPADSGAKASGSAPGKMQGEAKKASGAAQSGMTTAQKIASAESSAPAAISKKAAIMDWGDTPTAPMKQLRAGTNGWTCMPTTPPEFGAASGEDPMCADSQWMAWGEAWGKKVPPKITGTGIAYMLKGDKGGSNTDPFATGPTPSNQWVTSPPHVMVLLQDPKLLDAFPTDPQNGGPWVMFKGTPYAHLMVPVSPAQAAKMMAGK
jgi:hypothetical protein